MKTISLIAVAVLLAIVAQAQPISPPRPIGMPITMTPPGAQSATKEAKEPVNYLIRVEWKEPKADKKFLEVLTTEGQFELDTIQKASVKIDNNDIPVTLKFSGTIRPSGDDKAKLSLFLGRTVPYVTSTYGNSTGSHSSYSQLSVGLNSNVIVKFGKSVVIQNDENGEISVLVKCITD